MICDRMASARGKGKVYKTIARPAMLSVSEALALAKGQEVALEFAELKILPFSLGVPGKDRFKNGYIRETS